MPFSDRRASIVCALQDHPDDRAWLKHVFDFVAPNGELTREKVPDLLTFFYRNRPAGPTLSGTTLHAYPESEKDFLLALYPPDPSATVSFMALMDALQDAQGASAPRLRRARDAPPPGQLPRPSYECACQPLPFHSMTSRMRGSRSRASQQTLPSRRRLWSTAQHWCCGATR